MTRRLRMRCDQSAGALDREQPLLISLSASSRLACGISGGCAGSRMPVAAESTEAVSVRLPLCRSASRELSAGHRRCEHRARRRCCNQGRCQPICCGGLVAPACVQWCPLRWLAMVLGGAVAARKAPRCNVDETECSQQWTPRRRHKHKGLLVGRTDCACGAKQKRRVGRCRQARC